MRVGLAGLKQPESVWHDVGKIEETLGECERRGVQIVCLPETYLPGLRGTDLVLPVVLRTDSILEVCLTWYHFARSSFGKGGTRASLLDWSA